MIHFISMYSTSTMYNKIFEVKIFSKCNFYKHTQFRSRLNQVLDHQMIFFKFKYYQMYKTFYVLITVNNLISLFGLDFINFR